MATTTEHSPNNIANELTALHALANELEDYIIDGQVYRTVLVTTERGNYRMEMSGGDLLARMHTLQTLQSDLTSGQKEELNRIITQIETTKYSLKTRFHDLLRRELNARLDTSRWADDERREEQEDNERTPAEEHNRLCIDLIRAEL